MTLMGWVMIHNPVMLQEVVRDLADLNRGLILDVTVGAGGHSRAMLEATPETVRLIGIDRDETALELAGDRLSDFSGRFELYHTDFEGILDILGTRKVDRLIADLGISSMQLEQGRGFSFMDEGELDMRMDRGEGITAMSVLRDFNVRMLEELFRLVNVPKARSFARYVKELVKQGKITSARDFARAAEEFLPKGRSHNPATLPFLALRLAVNRELEQLQYLLNILPDIAADGAKLGFITYHSLEDRLVKQTFRDFVKNYGWSLLYKKGITPQPDEVQRNPRARSARLRIIVVKEERDQ